MTVKNNFSERLKALASKKNIFQTDLVRDLKKHSSTISKWWNGEIVPGPKNIRLIADYFGCDVDWLATGKGAEGIKKAEQTEGDIQTPQTTSEPLPRLIQKYDHLTWRFQHVFDFLLETYEDDAIAINDFMAKLEKEFLIEDPDYRLWMYQKREQAAKRQKKRAAEDNLAGSVVIKSTSGGKS